MNSTDAIKETLARLDLAAQIDAEKAMQAALDNLEPYDPTEQDLAGYRAWCLEVDRRNQDLEDAYRECDYMDILEGIAQFTDQDLEAAGLPVG